MGFLESKKRLLNTTTVGCSCERASVNVPHDKSMLLLNSEILLTRLAVERSGSTAKWRWKMSQISTTTSCCWFLTFSLWLLRILFWIPPRKLSTKPLSFFLHRMKMARRSQLLSLSLSLVVMRKPQMMFWGVLIRANTKNLSTTMNGVECECWKFARVL